MPTLEYTVTINKPISEVFAFVSRPENMPKWAQNVTEAIQTSEGPVQVGTTCSVVSKAMGKQLDQDFVVTEYEPDRVYAAKTTVSPFPMETRYTLKAVDGGTIVHAETSAELGGFMKMAGPLLAVMLKKQFKADHEALKKLLESQ